MTDLILRLSEGEYSCLVELGDRLIEKSGMGVSPLLAVYNQFGNSLSGCRVADTVIGKAAASIIVLLGAREAYGEIMSEPGLRLLSEHGIAASYGSLVPKIQNRKKDGACPLESAVAAANTPTEALQAINDFLKAI